MPTAAAARGVLPLPLHSSRLPSSDPAHTRDLQVCSTCASSLAGHMCSTNVEGPHECVPAHGATIPGVCPCPFRNRYRFTGRPDDVVNRRGRVRWCRGTRRLCIRRVAAPAATAPAAAGPRSGAQAAAAGGLPARHQRCCFQACHVYSAAASGSTRYDGPACRRLSLAEPCQMKCAVFGVGCSAVGVEKQSQSFCCYFTCLDKGAGTDSYQLSAPNVFTPYDTTSPAHGSTASELSRGFGVGRVRRTAAAAGSPSAHHVHSAGAAALAPSAALHAGASRQEGAFVILTVIVEIAASMEPPVARWCRG